MDELVVAAKSWSELGVDFLDVRFDVIGRLSDSPRIRERLSEFESLVEKDRFFPLRISIGTYAAGKPRFACDCFAPFEKLIVDPFGLVWACCLQSQPSFRPPWANVGDLESQSLREIVINLNNRFPRTHCTYCTPWEAQHNIDHEDGGKSHVAFPRVRSASADN